MYESSACVHVCDRGRERVSEREVNSCRGFGEFQGGLRVSIFSDLLVFLPASATQ